MDISKLDMQESYYQSLDLIQHYHRLQKEPGSKVFKCYIIQEIKIKNNVHKKLGLQTLSICTEMEHIIKNTFELKK